MLLSIYPLYGINLPCNNPNYFIGLAAISLFQMAVTSDLAHTQDSKQNLKDRKQMCINIQNYPSILVSEKQNVKVN